MRILSLQVDDGGCGWYRVRQPLAMIGKHTDHEAHVVDPQKDHPMSVLDALNVADVVIMRPRAEKSLETIPQTVNDYRKEKGIKEKWDPVWVMDIDDNVENISPYSNHYKDHGVEEVKHGNDWLWKDGQGGFDIQQNRENQQSLIDAFGKVDLIQVTTSKLQEYAQQYNDNVAVLPNCVNLDTWWKLPFKKNRKLRIGWSGGSSHYVDLYSIKEPLNKLMREYDFQFVFVGHHFPGIIDDDNKKNMENHAWVPFNGHSYRSMCMNLDIAIAPVKADFEFNWYKSSIKYTEYSAMEVPTLATDCLPYNDVITDGENGLLYKDEDEFYKKMKKLIEDEKLRRKLGKEARKWVEENRDAKKCVKIWTDAYQQAIERKND